MSTRAFQQVRGLVRPPAPPPERCELCSAPLGPSHPHLLEPVARKLVCSCEGCSLLFTNPGPLKYKRVPRLIRYLTEFQLTDSQWDGLMMPINMAFFFRSTPQGRVMAMYPSPAGATESLLEFDTWDEIARENPALQEMEDDVEALLVNRIGHARGFTAPEYFIVPIDECFKLVGLIRGGWNGLSGGTEVWHKIAEFFTSLKNNATPITPTDLHDLAGTPDPAAVRDPGTETAHA